MMRTAQRDQSGFSTIVAGTVDAASGAGSSNGIPYSWARNVGGVYEYYFSRSLAPIAAHINVWGSGMNVASVITLLPGYVKFSIFNSSSGANVSISHTLTITAIDRRN